jgi:hypothetical protein
VHYVVRKLPFHSTRTSVTVKGHDVPVKADQIIVWVSVAPGGTANLDRGSTRFPAILDTGHNHNFSIQEQQLIEWAGIDQRTLSKLGEIRLGSDRLPLLEANLWLYPNVPGKSHVAAEGAPYCLELDAGVAVYPRAMTNAPRLPLLGLRAMRLARLQLNIDCQPLYVTIRTKRQYWVF